MKAGYGKTVRPVCAADGGKLFIGRLLRPDSGEAGEQSGAIRAEPVERRAGAKGNADQQSTCRTQSRENVSQALERIRKAARQRKKERFTALFHHISVDLLGRRSTR